MDEDIDTVASVQKLIHETICNHRGEDNEKFDLPDDTGVNELARLIWDNLEYFVTRPEIERFFDNYLYVGWNEDDQPDDTEGEV